MSDAERPISRSELTQDTIEATQHLAAIVEFSDDAIISKDLNSIIQSWNAGAERIFGYSASEAIGKSITMVIPPELHDQEPLIVARIANGERVDRFETVRQRKDGSQFHISVTVSPIRDRSGKIVGASKIGRDISDLRLSQEKQELLLREMSHRVKNLFAVANGVVALSVRSATTPKELASSVQSRLSALSRAHELILPRQTGDAAGKVELGELVKMVLAPYDHSDQRISFAGPAVECGNSVSTSMALLLHEFATNSVKYGALADPEGQLTITWWLRPDAVALTWTERVASDPERRAVPGFGSFLVEATARSIGAEIDRVWTDQGLAITIMIPNARMLS
jgi:PAS domain S-box-containing protein